MDWGPNTEEETRAFIGAAMRGRQASPRTHYDLAVALAESDAVIGGCRIWIESAQHLEASIGYSLAQAHWARGYATELARGRCASGSRRWVCIGSGPSWNRRTRRPRGC
jgi:RimJ/RimL family protein N-acetyltransferase